MLVCLSLSVVAKKKERGGARRAYQLLRSRRDQTVGVLVPCVCPRFPDTHAQAVGLESERTRFVKVGGAKAGIEDERRPSVGIREDKRELEEKEGKRRRRLEGIRATPHTRAHTHTRTHIHT